MNESPLPFFAPGADPGASFVDLLRRMSPRCGRRCRRRPAGIAAARDSCTARPWSPIRYAGGVVMAGDRRATAGMTIASRRIEKVFPADDFSGVAIAGAAGPAVEMVRLFQIQLEHYEKIEGEQLSLEGKANQLAVLVRANLPAAMQGFVVVPLFAGYDDRAGARPRVQLRRHRRQVRGSRLPGQRLRRRPRPQLDQGAVARGHRRATTRVDLALRALFAAADEDAATGGPDLVRRIFPTVAVIDADGYTRRRRRRHRRPAPRRCSADARRGPDYDACPSTSRPSR